MQTRGSSTGASRWAVHKFGGTCLADAGRFVEAARLIERERTADRTADRTAIVVSASAGVTDLLIRSVELASARDDRCLEALREARAHNEGIARALLGAAAGPVLDAIAADALDIEDVLRGVRVTRAFARETLERVAGCGEPWSAQLLRAHLAGTGHPADWLDARQVLCVEHGTAGPAVDWETSRGRLGAWLERHSTPLVVITGYIASDRRGIPTTLQRNGSDFSASIFARLLEASSITIWTDVDGIMSADPRSVPDAVLLPELSYDEAMELAHFGAEVLHPHTMAPAIEGRIPIRIRNAFRPDAPGTVLQAPRAAADRAASISPRAAVKGFSSTDQIALLNVEGAGMIGVPGIAHRLFGALREVAVSVMMISQASSEHSICVAVRAQEAEAARAAVERAFLAELQHGQIRTVDVSGPYCVLAAVGDGMVRTPGVAARFFGALGKAGISAHAIAQGSSERNISVVVAAQDRVRALRAVHAGFYLSDQTLSVGLVGPGRVGEELLRQLGAQQELLRSRFQIDLRVRGIASSSSMVLDERGLDPLEGRAALRARGVPADLDAFTSHVQADHLPHAVVIECTASGTVAARHARWLGRGIHVITANKKASSGSFDGWQQLRELGRQPNTHYLYEATVGAGLPVITTLRDLIQTGDRVLRIEGMLSGTLSFLFDSLDAGRPFSSAVAEARRRGYTEPDLRDDLSGTDVARKAVILAREAGLPLELGDIPVESLVPAPLREVDDPDAFVAGLVDHDDDMEQRRAAAERDGEVLRYVAVVEADRSTSVGLGRYPREHAFARVRGGDNIIAFTTERYRRGPLIVQGPGAGPEVTAGGVFADLLRLAAYLGART